MNHPSAQLTEDLNQLFPQVAPDLSVWQEQNLLITGGTGFFGKWLLETINFSRKTGKMKFRKVFVLSRNPHSFLQDYPHLQDFEFIEGDIRSFKFPDAKIHGLIHGATSASAKLYSQAPNEMYETIVEGTRRALLCARESRGCRFLMISSGAVYGKKTLKNGPSKEEDFDFSDSGKINDPYADGKREAERLSVFSDFGQSAVIARCFAFVGPYLPLKEHFAIGNFISNALEGQEILINGDGSPLRSYLYASELVQALFRIMTKGALSSAYNVGSADPISIEKLAEEVAFQAKLLGLKPLGIRILSQEPKPPDPAAYLPSTDRVSKTLQLDTKIDLSEAISRTLRYHLKNLD